MSHNLTNTVINECQEYFVEPYDSNGWYKPEICQALLKCCAVEEMSPLPSISSTDIASEDTSTKSEETDFDAIIEMLIDGMQCEAVSIFQWETDFFTLPLFVSNVILFILFDI